MRTLPVALGPPALCPALPPPWGPAWRTDGRVGAFGAEPECHWGLSSCMTGPAWAKAGLCVCAQGPASSSRAEEDREGWGPPCGHMGLLWVWRPLLLPGRGWCPVWAPKPLLPGQDWESYLPLPVISLRILCFSCTWSSMPQLLQSAPEPQMTSQ